MINDPKVVISDWKKVKFDEIATNITDRIEKPIESGLERLYRPGSPGH